MPPGKICTEKMPSSTGQISKPDIFHGMWLPTGLMTPETHTLPCVFILSTS